jgi:hypothetical protein
MSPIGTWPWLLYGNVLTWMCSGYDRFQLEGLWAELVLLTFNSVLRKLYTEPSIDASFQISVHLDKLFQRRRFFRNWPIRNNNCLWWPCLLTDQDNMHNLYTEPFIDDSHQVSIHLAKRFQRRRFFRHRPIRNKNCLWQPCLWPDRDEISNLCRGPSINASYQVSNHLDTWLQRRRFF